VSADYSFLPVNIDTKKCMQKNIFQLLHALLFLCLGGMSSYKTEVP